MAFRLSKSLVDWISMEYSPYDESFKWLIRYITPEDVIAFQLSEEFKDHIDELVYRKSEGTITSGERTEIDKLIDFEHFVMLIKIRAEVLLNSRP